MLQNLRQYFEIDVVIVGDSSTHTIIHICDTYLNYGINKIKLQDALLVLALAKNLLSIGQLTTDYPYNCEFYSVGFIIKEWETNCVLMSG